MKSLLTFFVAIPALLLTGSCDAQIKNLKTETVNVYGNCGTCKKNIETAANTKKVSSAVWNKETKIAILTYDSTKTTSDAILKNIALAGYDNQNYIAPDNAYSKLDNCCQYERKQVSKEMTERNSPEKKNGTMNSMPTQNTGTQDKDENLLSHVYTAYFEIKDALIKGDGNAASSKAKELYKEVDAVPMDKLPAAQHTVWMKFMKDVLGNAEQIKSTTKVEVQREHFTKLSTTMYEVMKSIKADYPIYFDHCPMYNDGKGGDWLSKDSEIKNPYYGAQMLTCGNNKAIIK